MALHSKKDFAAMCGMQTKGLSVYIQRGKVILSGDFIDDSIKENLDFQKKWAEKNGVTGQPAVAQPENISKGEYQDPVKQKRKAPNVKDPELDPNGMGYTALDKRRLVLENEKKVEEIEILKVKKDKLHGVVIPTDLVKILFSQHTKSILVEFNNSVDKILTIFTKRKGLNNDEVAEIRKDLIAEINTAVDKSIDETKKNIRNVVNEYAEKRGKGERT